MVASFGSLLQGAFILWTCTCQAQKDLVDNGVPPLSHSSQLLERHTGSKCCILRDRGHGREHVSLLCDGMNRCLWNEVCDPQSFSYPSCGSLDHDAPEQRVLPCCLGPGILCDFDDRRQCVVQTPSSTTGVCGPQLCPSRHQMSVDMQHRLSARNITLAPHMRHGKYSDPTYELMHPNAKTRKRRAKWEHLEHSRTKRGQSTMPLHRKRDRTTKHLKMKVAASQKDGPGD